MDLDNHHKLSGNSFVTISSLCYLQILRFKDLEIFADISKKRAVHEEELCWSCDPLHNVTNSYNRSKGSFVPNTTIYHYFAFLGFLLTSSKT